MRVVPLLLAVSVVTSRLALAQQQQQPPAAAAELKVLEPGAGFRVRMPGAPKMQPIQQTMEDGSELRGAAWFSQVGPHVYRVRYLDLPQPPEGTAVDWLGNVQEWLLEEVDARPGKVEPATLQGHPGRHLTFASENAQGSMRFYVVGLRVYQLLLIYPHGMAGPANTQAYFDSLELTEPVAAATTKAAPTPVVLAPGQSLQAEIAPGDMQGDLGSPVDQYFIRGKRGQRVTLEVRGDSMAMFVQVKAPAKGPSFSEASERAGAVLLFTRTLPADGDYLVTVSSNEVVRKFGAYRIALREERGRWTPPRTEPRVEELTLGQEVEGTLSHDDAIDENWNTFRRYRYRGAAGQRVLFTVRSEDLPRSEEPFGHQNLRLLQARTGKDAHRTIPLGESSRTVLQVASEPNEGEDGDLFVDVVGVAWTPVRDEASFRLSVVPVRDGTPGEPASTPVSAGHIAEPGYVLLHLGGGFANAAEEDFFFLSTGLTFGHRLSKNVALELAPGLDLNLSETNFISGLLGAGVRLWDPDEISLSLVAGPTYVTEGEEGPSAQDSGLGIGGRAELRFASESGLGFGILGSVKKAGELTLLQAGIGLSF